jgi:hypothetical protein
MVIIERVCRAFVTWCDSNRDAQAVIVIDGLPCATSCSPSTVSLPLEVANRGSLQNSRTAGVPSSGGHLQYRRQEGRIGEILLRTGESTPGDGGQMPL